MHKCTPLQAAPRIAQCPWCPALYPLDLCQCAGALHGASAPLPAALACAARATPAQTAAAARRGTTGRACAARLPMQVSTCCSNDVHVRMQEYAAHQRGALQPPDLIPDVHGFKCVTTMVPAAGLASAVGSRGLLRQASASAVHACAAHAQRVELPLRLERGCACAVSQSTALAEWWVEHGPTLILSVCVAVVVVAVLVAGTCLYRRHQKRVRMPTMPSKQSPLVAHNAYA